MKIFIPLTLISVFFFSACAIQNKNNSKKDEVIQSITSTSKYLCKSDEIITTTYSNELAKIEYKSNIYNMKITVSASGSRYVGGGLEWWTKGTGEGILLKHLPDETSGDIIETCREF